LATKNCIIIINDNTDLLNLFKAAFEHEKIDTYAFTDPTLALEKIKLNPQLCSVAIIDYSSQLRKSQRRFAHEAKAINNQIKILLTSGFNLTQQDISKDGYDQFLQLPVKVSNLVSTVKEMLRAS
jgi:DNA-binding NtrC family response regulator